MACPKLVTARCLGPNPNATEGPESNLQVLVLRVSSLNTYDHDSCDCTRLYTAFRMAKKDKHLGRTHPPGPYPPIFPAPNASPGGRTVLQAPPLQARHLRQMRLQLRIPHVLSTLSEGPKRRGLRLGLTSRLWGREGCCGGTRG